MTRTFYKISLLLALLIFGLAQVSYAQTAQRYPEFCSVFNRTLLEGDIGPDVKQLQTVLAQEGIAFVSPTGFYGSVTAGAVKTFQIRNGIFPAGKVGPQTFSAMRNRWCSDNALPGTIGGGSGGVIVGSQQLSIQPVSSSANSVTISWNTNGVTSCTIQKDNDLPFPVGAQGQQTFTLFNESRFVLSCLDSFSRVQSRQILVRPNQLISNLPIVNLTINPVQVILGQSATISWNSQNTNYCTSNVPGYNNSNLSTSGFIPVTINSNNQSYTFTCFTSTGLSASQTITPSITTSNLIPQITSLNYSNNLLTWTSINTNSCSISGTNLNNIQVPVNGSYSVSTPANNSIWTLTCIGSNGSLITRQVSHTVGGTGSLNGLLEVKVRTNKSTYSVGEPITFTASIRNISNSNIVYNEPICDQFYAFTINGASVYSTPQPQCLAIGFNTITLSPNEIEDYSITVMGNVSNVTNSVGSKIVNFNFYPSSTMGTLNINETINILVQGTTSNQVFSGTNQNGTVSLNWYNQQANTSNQCSLYRHSALGPNGNNYSESTRVLLASGLANASTYNTVYIGTSGNFEAPGMMQFTLDCGVVKLYTSVPGILNVSGGTGLTTFSVSSNAGRIVNLNMSKAPYSVCSSGNVTWGDSTGISTPYSYQSTTPGVSCQTSTSYTYPNSGIYNIAVLEQGIQVATIRVDVK